MRAGLAFILKFMSNKNNLPLRYEPYANHCLAWSIFDEIVYGKHNFEEFCKVLLDSSGIDVRRYAEILYHKTRQGDTLIKMLRENIAKRAKYDFLGASKLEKEFEDWGLNRINRLEVS